MTAPPTTRTPGERDSVGFFDRSADWYAASLDAPPFTQRFALFEAWMDRYTTELSGGAALNLGRERTCLDLGCGPGTLAIRAAQRGFRTVALDGSRSMLDIAARAAREHAVELELRQAVVPLPQDLLLELTGRVDLLVCSSVIEYVDDDRELIEQCRRLLAPGGLALISFVNRASAFRILERWGRTSKLFRTSAPTGRKHQHRESDARELCERAGMRVVEVEYFAMRPAMYRVWRFASQPRWLNNLFLVAARAPLG